MKKANTNKELTRAIREFRLRVKKLYGEKLLKIILYGSWSRGKGTKESDIDLMVVLKGKIVPGKEIDRMIEIITDINMRYGLLLAVYPISEKDYLEKQSPFLINVRRDGIQI